MKTSKQLKSLLVGGGLLIGLALVLTGGGTPAQIWHMRLAGRHAPLVRRQLALHPEFQNVYVTITTAGGGSLLIIGNIRDAAQKEEIKQIVRETKPPVNVRYSLRLPTEVPGHEKPAKK